MARTVSEDAGSAYRRGRGGPRLRSLPLPRRALCFASTETCSLALDEAERRLGELEIAGEMVPSVDWFITCAFVRRRRCSRRRSRGTQATLTDLLTIEAGADSGAVDVQDACATTSTRSPFARGGFARRTRLPLSFHSPQRGAPALDVACAARQARSPARIRRSAELDRGSRPETPRSSPPPHELAKLLGDLERYIHGRDALRRWCAPRSSTCSSRTIIPTSTATAASGASW